MYLVNSVFSDDHHREDQKMNLGYSKPEAYVISIF